MGYTRLEEGDSYRSQAPGGSAGRPSGTSSGPSDTRPSGSFSARTGLALQGTVWGQQIYLYHRNILSI